MTLDEEILNAAIDDWEDIEPLYLSVCFEFVNDSSTPTDSERGCWHARNSAVRLVEVIESVCRLAAEGMLKVRREDDSSPTVVSTGDALQCWFKTSVAGRMLLNRRSSN